MSSLMQSCRQLVTKESSSRGPPSGSSGKSKPAMMWRRLVLALMMMMANTRHTMAVEYLIKKPMKMPDEEDEAVTKKKEIRKTKDPQAPIRRAIGQPLSRSQAQKKWNREVEACPHEEEYIRHRAGKGHFWFTCLQCGGRWERLQAPSSSSTQVVTTTAAPESFPTYLPPPRSRPDLKTQKVTVQQVPKVSQGRVPEESRGRTFEKMGQERMTGLMPVRRAKTPTPDPAGRNNQFVETYELAGNEMDEVDMETESRVLMEDMLTPEEIARINEDHQRDRVEQVLGFEHELASATEKEHILDP